MNYRFLKRLLNFLYLFVKSGNFKTSKFLSYYFIEEPLYSPDAEKPVVNFKNGDVFFPETNSRFSYEQVFKFWGAPLISLAQDSRVEIKSAEDFLIVEYGSMKFKVSERSSLFIINEMIREQLYDFDLNQEIVVCDVGMNTGIAALWLAQYPNVKKIYAYEPFKATYDLALQNFELNSVKNKITAFNYGLGKEDADFEVPFLGPGCATASTTDFFIKESSPVSGAKIAVSIKDIITVLTKIKTENPDCRLLLKLDCEGAEYDIMQRLSDADFLKNISVVLLEWHYKGKTSIIKNLRDNGFVSFAPINYQRKNLQWGMIYAFNCNNKSL